MVLRMLYLLLGVLLFASCRNTVGGQSQINEDISQGEALYSINLKITKGNADQEISSSIFSQELLVWKQNFVEKYGAQQWQDFRSRMIRNYGHDDEMNWFLK